MRTIFRKNQITMKKWKDLPPSGSGRKTGKAPKPYKYAAEMSFLVDVFKLEATDETYTNTQDHQTRKATYVLLPFSESK